MTLMATSDNKVLNNLFGMTTGLGYLPTTFDWSQIAYNTSPLVMPFWAQANVFAGWLCVYAVVAPILYYTNTWFTAYLPLTGSDAYDNTGSFYNSSRILDESGTIDETKYREYSPIFLPVTFALSYGMGFAVLSCLISHVLLYQYIQRPKQEGHPCEAAVSLSRCSMVVVWDSDSKCMLCRYSLSG